jgi:flagellar protein FlbT
MALKISLKPGERLIVGGAVIANGAGLKCDLVIENNVPVLREKDILRENDLATPCSHVYFTIQLMYVDPDNSAVHIEQYWKLVREILSAAPSMTGRVDRISEEIVGGRFYKALKLAGELMKYEEEVLRHVCESDEDL